MSSSASVNSAIPELLHVMEKLISLHRNLVDLLNEEYGHMVGMDMPGLMDAVQAKEVLIQQIWSHESLRIKCVDKLSADFGISLNEPNLELLSELSKRMPSEDQKKLEAFKQVLLLLISRAKEANVRNNTFAEKSLVRINQMKKNVLGLGNNTKENYSNSGMRNPITEQGGRLLTTEA